MKKSLTELRVLLLLMFCIGVIIGVYLELDLDQKVDSISSKEEKISISEKTGGKMITLELDDYLEYDHKLFVKKEVFEENFGVNNLLEEKNTSNGKYVHIPDYGEFDFYIAKAGDKFILTDIEQSKIESLYHYFKKHQGNNEVIYVKWFLIAIVVLTLFFTLLFINPIEQ